MNTDAHLQTSVAKKSLVIHYKLDRKSPSPKVMILTCPEIEGKTTLLHIIKMVLAKLGCTLVIQFPSSLFIAYLVKLSDVQEFHIQ